MSDSNKAEELLQQSTDQRRHTTEPTQQSDDSDVELSDAVARAYDDLDEGELHQNLTLRDGDLTALVEGLQRTGDLGAVAGRANEVLDRDGPVESRADLLKALVRVGLAEVASEEVAAAKDGKRRHLTSQADDF